MSFKPTVILWIIAGLLGIAIGVLEYRDKPEELDDAGRVFYGVEAASIAKIRLDRTTGAGTAESMVFEKRGGRWLLLEPYPWYANGNAVEDLIRSMLNKNYDRRFTEFKSLTEYGVDRPVATVTLWDNANNKYALNIGQPALSGSQFYGYRRDKERLYLLGASYVQPFFYETDAYVTRRAIDFRKADVREINVFSYFGDVRIARSGENEGWSLLSSHGEAVSVEAANSLLDNLSTDIDTWVDAMPTDLSPYGLDRTFAAVEVICAEKGDNGVETPRTYRLEFSEPLGYAMEIGYVYAKNADFSPVFSMSAALLMRLSIPLEVLREPLYLNFKKTRNIEKIRIDDLASGDSVTLQYHQQAQKMYITDHKPVDPNRPQGISDENGEIVQPDGLNNFRNAILFLRAEEFIPADEAGLARARLDKEYLRAEMALSQPGAGDESPETMVLRVNQDANGATYVWREGRYYLARIDSDNVYRILDMGYENFNIDFPWLEYLPPQWVRSVELETAVDQIVFDKRENGWYMNDIWTGLPIDDPQVGAALNPKHLQIEHIVEYVSVRFLPVKRLGKAGADPAKWGFDAPLIKLSLTYYNPETRTTTVRRVVVGSKQDDRKDYYATIDGGQTVITVQRRFAADTFDELPRLTENLEAEIKEQLPKNETRVLAQLRSQHAALHQLKNGTYPNTPAQSKFIDFKTMFNLLKNIERVNAVVQDNGCVELSGYYFYVFLPSQLDPAMAAQDAERFCIVAWPKHFAFTGRRVFVITEAGAPGAPVIYEFTPEDQKGIDYDGPEALGRAIRLQWIFQTPFDAATLDPDFRKAAE